MQFEFEKKGAKHKPRTFILLPPLFLNLEVFASTILASFGVSVVVRFLDMMVY